MNTNNPQRSLASAATPSAMALSPVGQAAVQTGRVVADRYRLEEFIGSGAMGVIYRALDLELGEPCAIKLAHPAASAQEQQQLSREATIGLRLRHPNIIQVRALAHDKEQGPLLVLELLHGESLESLLGRVGKLPVAEVRQIIGTVGAALQYAHDQGVLHGDVNPSNVYLCTPPGASGSAPRAHEIRLIDFGLARTLAEPAAAPYSPDQEPPQHAPQRALGTTRFCAPEVTQQQATIGAAADQWSLGVMAYQMLAGRLPFDSASPLELCIMIQSEDPPSLRHQRPDIPHALCSAIEVALAKDPRHRFQRVAEFLTAMAEPEPHRPTLGTPVELGSAVPTYIEPEGSHRPPRTRLRPANEPREPGAAAQGGAAKKAAMIKTVQYSSHDLQRLIREEFAATSGLPEYHEDATVRYKRAPTFLTTAERRVSSAAGVPDRDPLKAAAAPSVSQTPLHPLDQPVAAPPSLASRPPSPPPASGPPPLPPLPPPRPVGKGGMLAARSTAADLVTTALPRRPQLSPAPGLATLIAEATNGAGRVPPVTLGVRRPTEFSSPPPPSPLYMPVIPVARHVPWPWLLAASFGIFAALMGVLLFSFFPPRSARPSQSPAAVDGARESSAQPQPGRRAP